MILVMDVGNTNIKTGLFDGERLVDSWRISTLITRTSDEYGAIMSNLLSILGKSFGDITGIIMSSVTPSINYTLEHMCNYYTGIKPIVVKAGIKTGLNIKYDNPKELGADRIVNAVAANKLYGGTCIVIDFGTATTFSVVNQNAEFLGGLICPGIKSSIDALVNTTAKLPRIELERPQKIIGKTTVTNMQSGVINGFTGLTSYIIKEIKDELKEKDVTVIATGGMSELVFQSKHDIIDVTDRTLTLKGLKIVYDLNKEEI